MLVGDWVTVDVFDSVGRNPRLWNRFEILVDVPRET